MDNLTYNAHEHRSRTGIVAHIPFNCKYPIKEGDTLYIDYMIIEDQSEQYIWDREKDLYRVPYDPEHGTLNNFAYAWDDGKEVHAINDWCFVEPLKIVSKEEVRESGLIIPETLKQEYEREEKTDMGILRYANHSLVEDLELSIGDLVQYAPEAGWDTKVRGVEMRMVQINDILCVIEGDYV
jgi:co-chaperonin GroES (HSP10)